MFVRQGRKSQLTTTDPCRQAASCGSCRYARPTRGTASGFDTPEEWMVPSHASRQSCHDYYPHQASDQKATRQAEQPSHTAELNQRAPASYHTDSTPIAQMPQSIPQPTQPADAPCHRRSSRSRPFEPPPTVRKPPSQPDTSVQTNTTASHRVATSAVHIATQLGTHIAGHGTGTPLRPHERRHKPVRHTPRMFSHRRTAVVTSG